MKYLSAGMSIVLLIISGILIFTISESDNAFQFIGVVLILAILLPLIIQHTLHAIKTTNNYKESLSKTYAVYAILGIIFSVANLSKGIDLGFIVILIIPTILFIAMWRIYKLKNNG